MYCILTKLKVKAINRCKYAAINRFFLDVLQQILYNNAGGALNDRIKNINQK